MCDRRGRIVVGLMIARHNLLYSTFIGLPVEISNSSQRRLVGLKGTVVDETKNLIVIELAAGAASPGGTLSPKAKEIRIPKVSSTFRFTVDNGEKVEVVGSTIAFRPHERPKKV